MCVSETLVDVIYISDLVFTKLYFGVSLSKVVMLQLCYIKNNLVGLG